jgi:hypothetical protein
MRATVDFHRSSSCAHGVRMCVLTLHRPLQQGSTWRRCEDGRTSDVCGVSADGQQICQSSDTDMTMRNEVERHDARSALAFQRAPVWTCVHCNSFGLACDAISSRCTAARAPPARPARTHHESNCSYEHTRLRRQLPGSRTSAVGQSLRIRDGAPVHHNATRR